MTLAGYIAWSVILFWVMIIFAFVIKEKGWSIEGMMHMFSNRETEMETSSFAGRAERSAKNMAENMILFGAAAVAAVAAGKMDGSVLTGAAIFFWARLVYWPVYLIGIPYLRTAVWVVSIYGILRMLLAVIG